MRVNWSWIKKRLLSVTCWHRWGPGDNAATDNPPHMACQKCGVWRWYPVIRRAA